MTESVGNQIRLTLDELMDLLDETPLQERGPIYARIDDLHGTLDKLIDEIIDKTKSEYDAALSGIEVALDEVKNARKKIIDVLKALGFVDQAIVLLGNLIKAL
jgi:hypothetical protein